MSWGERTGTISGVSRASKVAYGNGQSYVSREAKLPVHFGFAANRDSIAAQVSRFRIHKLIKNEISGPAWRCRCRFLRKTGKDVVNRFYKVRCRMTPCVVHVGRTRSLERVPPCRGVFPPLQVKESLHDDVLEVGHQPGSCPPLA